MIKIPMNSPVNSVEKMDVICSIQSMNEKIHGQPTPYMELATRSLEDLREEQERLIPLYNNAIKTKKS